MRFFVLVLWLQMSAQPQIPCQSAKLYYNGVLVDEEPHCGFLNQVINMPTALDDITRAEFAEADQRAADETDGKPPVPVQLPTVCKLSEPACEIPAARTPEPVDVPAVQDTKLVVKKGELAGDTLCRFFLEQSDQNCRASANIYHSTFTCADKSRVLLTSEDGKKWCHKVQP